MKLSEIKRTLKVSPNTIESWLKKGSLEDGRTRSGLKPIFQYIRHQLFAYFTEERNLGRVMNEKLLMIKVNSLCTDIKKNQTPDQDHVIMHYTDLKKEKKEDIISISKLESFLFSHGWFMGWRNEFKISNRRATHIAQASPEDKLDIAIEYIEALKVKRRSGEYNLSMIINFDETPVYFDMIGNTTLNLKGKKTIFLKSTNSQKKRITAGLAVAASGHILKPIIIFKGTNKGIIKGVTNKMNYILKKNENSWITKELFLHYIQTELKQYLNNQRRALKKPEAKGLFLFDCFSGHLDEKIFCELRKINCEWAVIPPGCTSLVQPLDVSINRPFKSKLKNSWTEWFSKKTKTDNKAPQKQQIYNWIVDALQDISSSMVIKSFLASGCLYLQTSFNFIRDYH
jgi:hypothetical protein